jgi:D-beta-D-heptose 7-phosphate kinase/D-beta-D-heptose 1-phosphate adenosyltransferase
VTRRPVAITVVGDALLDVDWVGTVDRVCADAPVPVVGMHIERHRPGGAGLAARCAAQAGAAVTLVTAVGADQAGARLRDELAADGVRVVDLGLDGPTPVKLRLRAGGQSLVRVDQGCSPVCAPGAWTPKATAAVEAASALLVSDYGRGLAGLEAFRAVLDGLLGDRGRRIPVVWDPHRQGTEPPGGLDVLVPNLDEASRLAGNAADLTSRGAGATAPDDHRPLADVVAGRFGCPVALTLGERGAILALPGRDAQVVPVDPVPGDACGAGDRFAATVAVDRAQAVGLLDAVRHAVVAARDQVAGSWNTPAAPRPTAPVPARAASGAPQDPLAWAAALRAAGGRVVAAGGCFDVLHAGHVRLLEAARRLGDGLVVCLNGDLSVRRLKGRHRPVNPVDDRSAVLAGLGCVDAVMVFDEDTPCEVLRRLRPDVFVKGSDYAGDDLPERAALAEWGGELVLLPVTDGRSTTRILRAAAAAG